MRPKLKAKAENTAVWHATPYLQVLFLLLAFLSGCATTPREIYDGYSGTDLRERSLATVKLTEADWAKFNELHVDGGKYTAVRLLPGSYRVVYSRTFRTRLLNPKKTISREGHGTVVFEAGRTYRLRAVRTFGRGFIMRLWIEDEQGNIVKHSGRIEQSASVLSELRIADPYSYAP